MDFFSSSSSKKKDVIETVIGPTSQITGTISVQQSMRMDGKIEGDVKSQQSVIVGATAVVQGNIMCSVVIVNGEVDGNIIARESVELLDAARVTGDITTPRLSMSSGAFFEGNCKMAKKRGELAEQENEKENEKPKDARK